MNNNPVVLYVLLRSDLASIRESIGRAAAQANHAGTAHLHYMKDLLSDNMVEWQSETNQGFGTTIVLNVKEKQMRDILAALPDHFPCQIVNDPEYGIRDGEVIHFISLDTCAWVFGRKEDLRPYLGQLELY